jgi:hypothetical protein
MAAAWHIGCRRPLPRRMAGGRRRGGIRAGGRRGGESGRAVALGWAAASGIEMCVEDGEDGRRRVGEERYGTSERIGVARRRRGAHRGRARQGEAAATMTEKRGDLGEND